MRPARYARGLLAGGGRAECTVRGVVIHRVQGELHPIQTMPGHFHGCVHFDIVGDCVIGNHVQKANSPRHFDRHLVSKLRGAIFLNRR